MEKSFDHIRRFKIFRGITYIKNMYKRKRFHLSVKMEAFSGLFLFSKQFNNKTCFVGGTGVKQREITIH